MKRRDVLKLLGLSPIVPGVLMAKEKIGQDPETFDGWNLDCLHKGGTIYVIEWPNKIYSSMSRRITDDMKHMEGMAETFADEVYPRKFDTKGNYGWFGMT